jgi:MoaA/NifB/PqqE/SkfB family radical SAM enzyme
MEVYISQLIVEVTRRCNMMCDHCLRGDEQSIDMSDDVIKAVLSGVSSIGSLVFTGGEPTLAVDVIERFIDEA